MKIGLLKIKFRRNALNVDTAKEERNHLGRQNIIHWSRPTQEKNKIELKKVSRKRTIVYFCHSSRYNIPYKYLGKEISRKKGRWSLNLEITG